MTTTTAPATQEPKKLSSAQIMERLDALTAASRMTQLQFHPAPLLIYKPQKAGNGAALKLDLRLQPTFGEGDYITEVDGGLFLELVAQTGKDDRDNATFGWKDENARISAKLGMPDITQMLLAIRTVRHRGKKVPAYIQPKNDESGLKVSMFHKFEQESTAISVEFSDSGTVIQISKSKENRRSIKLALHEELAFEAYLQLALNAFLYAGKR